VQCAPSSSLCAVHALPLLGDSVLLFTVVVSFNIRRYIIQARILVPGWCVSTNTWSQLPSPGAILLHVAMESWYYLYWLPVDWIQPLQSTASINLFAIGS
jgi:hypothetical protein